jgi:hypothetical protein
VWAGRAPLSRARILQRPWLADPDIKELVSQFVTWKQSMPQGIQNSDCFGTWFKTHVGAMQVAWGSRIYNRKAAEHRFESVFRPMSRSILFLPASACEKKDSDEPPINSPDQDPMTMLSKTRKCRTTTESSESVLVCVVELSNLIWFLSVVVRELSSAL